MTKTTAKKKQPVKKKVVKKPVEEKKPEVVLEPETDIAVEEPKVEKINYDSINGVRILNVTDVEFQGDVKMKKIDYIDGTTQHKTAEQLEEELDK